MKITINSTECSKNKLSINEVLIAIAIKNSIQPETAIKALEEKGIINKLEEEYYITTKGKETIDEILEKSLVNDDEKTWLENLAKEYRMKFPEGKIPGTPYYYRGSTKEIVGKLKRFLIDNKLDFTEENKKAILEAAEKYNRIKDEDPKFRMTAKYFISKQKPVTDEEGVTHIEETSELLSYLENKESQEIEMPDSWLVNLR